MTGFAAKKSHRLAMSYLERDTQPHVYSQCLVKVYFANPKMYIKIVNFDVDLFSRPFAERKHKGCAKFVRYQFYTRS